MSITDLFRSSSANISFGLSSQQDVTTYGADHKTVPSFDQSDIFMLCQQIIAAGFTKTTL